MPELPPRPAKLRSQRDINLWRIPLQLSLAAVALFGITMIPDVLDKYGVMRIAQMVEIAIRALSPAVRLERLVKLAFDQIRQASTTTPAVLIRQIDAVRRLA